VRSLGAAELLKLRKRPVTLVAASLTVGAVIAIVAVRFGLHASSPGDSGFHGPAGGGDGYRAALEGLFRFAFFAALLLGATVGTADRAGGVLKDLAATGVRRHRLFLARIPAAVLVANALGVAGFMLAVTAGLALPEGGPMPPLADVLHDLALLLVTVSTAACLSLGLAALIRSRVAAIVLFFAWETTVAPLIAHDPGLGNARWALIGVALNRFAREELDLETLGIPLAVAAAVVLLWIAATLGLAGWRETRREI